MSALKEELQRKITEIIKEIDPKDRKVQITAAASAVLAVYLFTKLTRKRNFWDEMPKYRRAKSDELADPNESSKIQRCSKPSDILEIAFAKSGPASMKPITVQEYWAKAVENGGDEPFIGVEQLQNDNS